MLPFLESTVIFISGFGVDVSGSEENGVCKLALELREEPFSLVNDTVLKVFWQVSNEKEMYRVLFVNSNMVYNGSQHFDLQKIWRKVFIL